MVPVLGTVQRHTKTLVTALCATLGLAAAGASAAPINGTGNLASNVIFGTGNTDGDFSGVTINTLDGDIELALRGKLRYDLLGNPQPIYNYDDDQTYTFNPADGVAPPNRSLFNIDWSVNSAAGGPGEALVDYLFVLSFDYDPTAATSFALVDVVAGGVLRDHAIGQNGTPEGAGEVFASLGEFNLGLATNNVAQNSWNAGFGAPPGFDPQTQGQFTAKLEVFDLQQNLIGDTSIDIVFGDVPSGQVPVPATLALLGLGLLTLRRRLR